MKLSFSTVGCPNWTWSEITSCAVDLGFNGVELRGLGDDLSLRSVAIFQPGQIDKTVQALKKTGLSISCVASNLLLCADYDEDEARHVIELARGLNCTYIRVLGDEWGFPGENADEALVYKNLAALALEAEKSGVVLLVETNGIWAQSSRLKKLIETIASPSVQVLWDVHHPFRYFGETPRETYTNIGRYVRHVHIKDSVMQDGRLVYKMLTYGDLPLRACLEELRGGGYDGFLSMEWVKRWNEDLEEPGVAFAHFVYSIGKLMKQAGV